MCGIIGVLSKSNNAGLIAYEGLKRLDYRGYDSWGLAINAKDIRVYKKTGRIGTLPKTMACGFAAIGHTRWATHGKISVRNAHPHVSQSRMIVVAHNGIVENFQDLKAFLEKHGFSFATETDTEVIPHLIEFYLKKGLELREAVRRAMLRVDGNYAILAMAKGYRSIIGARKGLPLVAGISDGTFLLASDLMAIAKRSKKVMFIKDSELIELNSGVKVFDIESGKEIKKQMKELKLDFQSADKGNFEHYMLKEIHEAGLAMRNASIQPEGLVEKAALAIKKADRVFIIGCGTSYHAALLGSILFNKIAMRQATAVLASELSNYLSILDKKSVVVALSQSGETADVLDAVRAAKGKGAKIIGLVNVVGSSLTMMSDITLMMNAGPEICVASTKNYLAQLSLLYMLANALAGNAKAAKEDIEKDARLADEVIKINEPKAKRLAAKLKDARSLFVIGKNENAVTALESALKIKEVSYIHAEGFPAAELKHGTIALVEKGVPVVVICSDSKDDCLSSAFEVKSRGATVIGVSTENNTVFDHFFEIPKCKLRFILSVIPMQLLAYYLAVVRKKDPDKPRNLAKSVTVK